MSTSITPEHSKRARMPTHGTRGGVARKQKDGFPFRPTLVLFLLIGGLVWWSGEEGAPGAGVVVENPADRTRRADVVWRGPDGTLSGSLLRVVEPFGSEGYRIPAEASACVRWIEDGSVRGAWPLSAGATKQDVAVLKLPASGHATTGVCLPELVDHRIRPALGRWMVPGDPVRLHRERMIPRTLHRRHRSGST